MSEIVEELTGNVDGEIDTKTELSLEKKVESFALESEKKDDVDLDGLVKKKNSLLNEVKKERLQRKSIEDELTQLRNQLKVRENEELERKQEYKKLYEQSQAELKGERQLRMDGEKAIVSQMKRKALGNELGGLKNEKYFSFANLDDIIVEEDGSINADSVRYAAQLFRANHSELIKKKDIPSIGVEAPSNTGRVIPKQNNDITSMNNSERKNLKSRLLRSR